MVSKLARLKFIKHCLTSLRAELKGRPKRSSQKKKKKGKVSKRFIQSRVKYSGFNLPMFFLPLFTIPLYLQPTKMMPCIQLHQFTTFNSYYLLLIHRTHPSTINQPLSKFQQNSSQLYPMWNPYPSYCPSDRVLISSLESHQSPRPVHCRARHEHLLGHGTTRTSVGPSNIKFKIDRQWDCSFTSLPA